MGVPRMVMGRPLTLSQSMCARQFGERGIFPAPKLTQPQHVNLRTVCDSQHEDGEEGTSPALAVSSSSRVPT